MSHEPLSPHTHAHAYTHTDAHACTHARTHTRARARAHTHTKNDLLYKDIYAVMMLTIPLNNEGHCTRKQSPRSIISGRPKLNLLELADSLSVRTQLIALRTERASAETAVCVGFTHAVTNIRHCSEKCSRCPSVTRTYGPVKMGNKCKAIYN